MERLSGRRERMCMWELVQAACRICRIHWSLLQRLLQHFCDRGKDILSTKLVRSCPRLFMYTHPAVPHCSHGALSQVLAAPIGTCSCIGYSWIAPCPWLILSLSRRVWDFWAVIPMMSKPCKWRHCHIHLNDRCVIKCPTNLGETQHSC